MQRGYWDGTLYPGADAQIEEAIDLVEARSACTCEVCGEERRPYAGGWLTIRCEIKKTVTHCKHAKKRLVPSRLIKRLGNSALFPEKPDFR
jgi:hypothetical protein